MTNNYRSNDSVMGVGEWVGALFILAIPIVNIIMYFIWAFSSNTNENLSNFCKATLLIALIGVGLAVLLGACSALF